MYVQRNYFDVLHENGRHNIFVKYIEVENYYCQYAWNRQVVPTRGDFYLAKLNFAKYVAWSCLLVCKFVCKFVSLFVSLYVTRFSQSLLERSG